MSIFRERLLEIIEYNNLTLKDFAKLSGVARSSLSHWTRFEVVPNMHSIIKVAKFFQCPVDYFTGKTAEIKATLKNIPSTFSERLKSLTAEKNITPYRVCMDLHFDTAMMTDWTNNGTLPSLDNLLLLTDYFNCSADYLLGLSDNKN